MSKLIISLLQMIHIAVILFAVSAGFWPWPAVWPVHMVFLALMFIHWRMNRNQCVLTQLEARLKGAPEVSEGGFIQGLWTKVTGRPASEKALQRAINSVMLVSFLISFTRWYAR